MPDSIKRRNGKAHFDACHFHAPPYVQDQLAASALGQALMNGNFTQRERVVLLAEIRRLARRETPTAAGYIPLRINTLDMPISERH
jgi:hypothetical protein